MDHEHLSQQIHAHQLEIYATSPNHHTFCYVLVQNCKLKREGKIYVEVHTKNLEFDQTCDQFTRQYVVVHYDTILFLVDGCLACYRARRDVELLPEPRSIV